LFTSSVNDVIDLHYKRVTVFDNSAVELRRRQRR
jgi:hypothetical protein